MKQKTNKPKYGLHTSAEFQKDFKKLVKNNKALSDRINRVLQLLMLDPFYQSLKTHKVNTKKHGLRYSSKVTGDVRIIWDFERGEAIILALSLGGHSGKRKVYK